MTISPLSTPPLVSMAIPVFNGANYLRFAVDSALAQTYPNVEVIIINDGSSDGGQTERIALSYGNKVKYLYKENGGVGSALNLAMEKASGEYFCWLSHDDVYLPEKIERQVEFIRSLPNDDVVVFCPYSSMDGKGEDLPDPGPIPLFEPRQAAYQLILGQWLHCCTVLAPRKLFLQFGGFREDLPTTQDYDLMVKLGLHYEFFGLPDVLLRARSHDAQGSLTLAHHGEVEKFFEEHVPMLTPEYMQLAFRSSRECVDAFVALGKSMRRRNFEASALKVCQRLLECEVGRADAPALLDAVAAISYRVQASEVPVNVDIPPADEDSKQSNLRAMKNFIKSLTPPILWEALRRIGSGRTDETSEVVPATPLPSVRTASLDFVRIYETNGFLGGESRSGGGSSLDQTKIVREQLPILLKKLNVGRMLDAPCGDWHWMQHVELQDVDYIGGDVVPAIVEHDNKTYGRGGVRFECLDIVTGPLPSSDLILCRDCLVHLPFDDALAALRQFRLSGAKWLLTTTFTDRESNVELYDGQVWRPLNLERAPFSFPKADFYINEGCTEGDNQFGDKCLALWRLDSIR